MLDPAAPIVVADFELTLPFENWADRGERSAFFDGIDDEILIGCRFTLPSPLLLGEDPGLSWQSVSDQISFMRTYAAKAARGKFARALCGRRVL